MQLQTARRSQRRFILWGVAAFAVLAWVQLSGLQTVLELRQAWRQEAQLEQDVERLEESVGELEASVESLASDDSEAIQLLAREKLGLARRGEIVVKVPNKQ
ncbi:MAG: hypothetical protein GC160_18295 [Acidobacteria bacterium]|nr:hypothetical protein [Acidobacteriota bacterium]